MTTVRLDIEYDGTGFAGWAKQPGLPSIEASLEEVLAQILQQPVTLSVAGRTDAGVHARGQVVSFNLEEKPGYAGSRADDRQIGEGDGEDAGEAVLAVDPGKLRRSANKLLPPSIAICRVSEAPPGFDARFSALSRSYAYSVLNREYPSPFRGRFVHYYAGRLDLALLEEAAALILGRHDFTAFTPTVTEHDDFSREITRSEWLQEDGLLVYRITAAGFLRNMVRVLVGTMLEIGRGYRPLTELPQLLTGASRPDAGKTAPPQGLCLEKVEYPSENPGQP
ncbi:MAG: tRNA pseudouridine(38-40) synthase TruA [Actinobacteria bacterium]|nr:tRNA pseudouridine(38-40) synthase TruA [Actinomycetota bacterium]